MALPFAAAAPFAAKMAVGGAIGGALLGGLSTKLKVDSEIRELESAEAMARRNARSARMGFYAQSNGFRMMSDLEQTRLARSHAQRIGNMEAKIGGSGAVAGEGTTWDVIVAQDAENQREMNTFMTQADSKVQDFIDQGDAQYTSFMNQADQFANRKNYARRAGSSRIFFGAIQGGAQGASSMASIASATG